MRRGANIVLGIVLLVAVFLLAYPLYVIRPFRYQGSHELRLALAIVGFRPLFGIFLALVSVGCVVWSWRQRRWFGRIVTAAVGLLTVACAFATRVNIFELAFKPVDHPVFAPAGQAKLAGDEEVISVRVKQAARAYPVRSMSYHHIVNDTVGGVPIVATY